VEESDLTSVTFAPSIVYSPDDPWMTLLRRLTLLPAVPISGSGRALCQPIWAEDAADAVTAALGRSLDGHARFELAGPEKLSYDGIVREAMRSFGRRRRLLHVPLPVVRSGLRGLQLVARDKTFATWEEAELMEIPMVSDRGTADAESLGVTPLRMGAVLGS
jgi:NADH dehydrogenase